MEAAASGTLSVLRVGDTWLGGLRGAAEEVSRRGLGRVEGLSRADRRPEKNAPLCVVRSSTPDFPDSTPCGRQIANPRSPGRAARRMPGGGGRGAWLATGAVTVCVVYAAWTYVSGLRTPEVPHLPRPRAAAPARGRAGEGEKAGAGEMDKGKVKKEKGKEPEKVRERGKDPEKVREKRKEEEKDKHILTKPLLEPPDKDKQILVLGLDGAGKTSVLHSLALNRVQHSMAPTQGFNEVCIHTEDSQMEFLEIGGSEPFRPYWEMYLSKGLLLIFVVDSADHSRLPEAKKHLHQLIGTDPILPLVVFANKQDLETAYRITDIHEALALSEVGNDRQMFLFGTQVTENGSEIPTTMQDAKDLIAHLAADIQRAAPRALCGLAS
ncbi:PREDICTED: ADP-ribosylation factor-like protein 9 [Condylura cristata]|uniref:ADP-ribosylation factor-like protein 9 n=1 Tax=Condylura cristata TaxID=143302 RepID=UPI000642B119|nr:PREDICTED: ADP-ribosylation factor-like protein 9 [Condylura cristata]